MQRQPGRHRGEDGHADRDREYVPQGERQLGGEERLADERDARDRDAQSEEDPEPDGNPQDPGHRGFGGGEQGDLLAGRADQAHHREPFLAAGGRQPGRGGDEDQHRRQDGQRHDGQDEVDAALPASRIERGVGQALGVNSVGGTGQPTNVVEIDVTCTLFGVCASCAGVRPMTMTIELGDGSAASPIVPAKWPG